MKKIVIVLGFVLAIGSNVDAQNFGVKVGLNLSKVNGPESESLWDDGESTISYNYLAGGAIGMTFEYEFNNNFGFTTGLGLSQKGINMSILDRQEYSDDSGNLIVSSERLDYKVGVVYAEVPLMFKCGGDIGTTKFYGMFGATIGVATFGKFTLQYTEEDKGVFDGQSFYYSDTETDSEYFGPADIDYMLGNLLNVGIMPGLGVEIGKVQLEATYNIGVNSVFGGEGATMNTMSCSLGYKFGKN